MEELFEFDLSDVDVAAFESVGTSPDQQQQQQQEQQQQQQLQLKLQQQQEHGQEDQTDPPQPSQLQQPLEAQSQPEPKPEPEPGPGPFTTLPGPEVGKAQPQIHLPTQTQLQLQSQSQPNSQQNKSQSQLQQPCKILLIPINSTKLMQLTSSSNKNQILQFHQQQPQQHHQQLLQQQNQHHQPPTPVAPPAPPAPIAAPTPVVVNDVPKRKPCNCTKSQCLKLYCDCFANGEFCSGCNCTNCSNSLSKEKERQKAITQCLERNPEAFRPKIGKAIKASMGVPAPDSIERRHTKGCNCKRSGCLKNYCECYEAKILCSNLCKCCGCKNYEESFERKTLMQLANSSTESARGILKNLLPTNNGSVTSKDSAKGFITDEVISASLHCLLQSAQQAEKDCMPSDDIKRHIQVEMGKCLRMIVDSVSEPSSSKRR